MKTENRILKNVAVYKLREYRKRYGAPETVNCAYGIDNEKSLTVLDRLGNEVRTFKKGTKLLLGFTCEKTISQNYFKAQIRQAKSEHEQILKESERLRKIEQEAFTERVAGAIEIVDANRSDIEQTKSRYNIGSCKWCNEVAFRVHKQYDVGCSVLKAALKTVYYSEKNALSSGGCEV